MAKRPFAYRYTRKSTRIIDYLFARKTDGIIAQ